jgi:hypothetical protein
MADMKEEISKVKEKNKRHTLLGSGPSPMRILARYLNNKDLAKKEKTDINKLIMKVDDMEEDHERRKISKQVEMMINRLNYKADLKKRQSKKENNST